MQKETLTFYPTSQQHWREWLQQHHETEPAVWVIFHKKQTGQRTLSWSEAVDEALCFGWIDSRAQPIDATQYRQFFSRRKPGGTWSKVNKVKIEQLIATGRMAPAGLASIEKAKQNGSWTLLDEVEELIIPADLARAFGQHPAAASYFQALSRTNKRNLLLKLVLAKRPETRQQRIAEIVGLGGAPK
ncbi:YdeI/OmpD-associated family protein [Hymenobacter sp. ASUV-10]|uniref:YdeI/OmpD-associated family protein n=1 Tax=Hymenobacter aranciens TaxID=3063996 RepID=A0ABT9BBM8_9BACT|nr:YdeI/OmpD-associated family protein [Hymenobacter sp. ASUV-10]MDO7875669.1 YdeI/OmpD-associated family protein [Hymenobacter sp. ASUV-10]